MFEDQPDDEFLCAVCLNILLEPTTLNCGHNVCRICLANWYLSSSNRKNECPQCRQTWEGHPQVNITLRNIIGKSQTLSNALAQHKAELPDDYEEKLKTFEAEMQQKKKQTADGKKSFYAGFIVAVIAVIVLYCISIWTSQESAKERVSKPVVLWGNEDVCQWLSSTGWAHNYSIRARELSIDGSILMFGDVDNLSKALNISDEHHHKAFYVAVDTLRSIGVKMPQSMWEYQALYPGRSLFLALTLKDSPRLTMLFLYLFYYEESFLPFVHTTMPREWNETLSQNRVKLPDPERSQLRMFWFLMLIFPYGMLGLFAWSMRQAHTVTHIFVLATCLLQGLLEVSFFSSCLWKGNWRPMMEAFQLKHHLKNIGSTLIFACAWPFCPYWLAKFIFCVCIYISPISILQQILRT